MIFEVLQRKTYKLLKPFCKTGNTLWILNNCTTPVVSCRSKGILSLKDFFQLYHLILPKTVITSILLPHYCFMYITEKGCYISRFLAFEVMIFKTIIVCSIIYTASSSGTAICKVNRSHPKNVGQKNVFFIFAMKDDQFQCTDSSCIPLSSRYMEPTRN